MKLILVVVAILGLAHALPVERALVDDLNDFIDLIPIAEIKAIIVHHNGHGDFTNIISYLLSEEFLASLTALRALPESQAVAAYLQDAGIDYASLYNRIKAILESASTRNSQISVRTLQQCWAEILEVFPFAELRALWQSKLETSTDFQDFVARLKGDTFKSLVEKVVATSEWATLLQKGRDIGLDVDAWITRAYAYLGW